MKSHTTMVLHVLGSILFMLIPFIVSDSFPDIQRFINNPLTGIEVFFQAKMLGVFYLNYFWLIPHVFNKKHYGIYFVILITILTAITVFSFSVLREQDVHARHYRMNHRHQSDFLSNKSQPKNQGLNHVKDDHYNQYSKKQITPVKYIIIRRIYLYVLVILFAFILRNRQKLKEAEEAKLKLEIKSLKSNLNPHTLFNLLNGIYAKALQQAADTAPQILNLSQFLRTLLKQSEMEYSSVAAELDFIKAYVALQNNRFTDQYKFEFKTSIQNSHSNIPTLITLPLIENAFSHLDFDADDPYILIEVTTSLNAFYLHVENSYNCKYDNTGNQLGLEQLKKRLNIYFPNAHAYSVKAENCVYTCFLKLPLI